MKSGDTSTHRPQTVNPADFQGAGHRLGQTRAASRATGANARARRQQRRGRLPVCQTRVNGALLSAPAAATAPLQPDMTGPGPNEIHKQGMARAAAEGVQDPEPLVVGDVEEVFRAGSLPPSLRSSPGAEPGDVRAGAQAADAARRQRATTRTTPDQTARPPSSGSRCPWT